MRSLALALLVAGTACSADLGSADPGAEEALSGDGSVGAQVKTTCSTSVVLPLSRQIADEVVCMAPTALRHFDATGGIHFTSSAVLPYLHPDAVKALEAVAAQSGNVQINSAFRTVAQQYLLFRWNELGRCDIPAAADPGNSNHEGGRALDLDDWSNELRRMTQHGFAHDVPGDDVHFDYLAASDNRGLDVHAFQRLWNRNHPNDRIDETGDYDAKTAARLAKAPAHGFAIGADCN